MFLITKIITFLFVFLGFNNSFLLSHSHSSTFYNQKVLRNATCSLNDADKKMSYALGVSIGKNFMYLYKNEKDIDISLRKLQFLMGIKDVLYKKSKMNFLEVEKSLEVLRVVLNKNKKFIIEKLAMMKKREERKHVAHFLRNKNVHKAPSGLLYLIFDKGHGKKITDHSTLTVNYKTYFTNGTEIAGSNKRPLTFLLKNAVLGLRLGLLHVREGGKIKLILPPKLSHRNLKMSIIPKNSFLIFDIQVLRVENKK